MSTTTTPAQKASRPRASVGVSCRSIPTEAIWSAPIRRTVVTLLLPLPAMILLSPSLALTGISASSCFSGIVAPFEASPGGFHGRATAIGAVKPGFRQRPPGG